MGVQCCPLLTAYLSAQTAFPASEKSTFVDMSGQMEGVSDHWSELGVTFDAIYSGFWPQRLKLTLSLTSTSASAAPTL